MNLGMTTLLTGLSLPLPPSALACPPDQPHAVLPALPQHLALPPFPSSLLPLDRYLFALLEYEAPEDSALQVRRLWRSSTYFHQQREGSSLLLLVRCTELGSASTTAGLACCLSLRLCSGRVHSFELEHQDSQSRFLLALSG